LRESARESTVESTRVIGREGRGTRVRESRTDSRDESERESEREAGGERETGRERWRDEEERRVQ